jgi:hypothetical protein
MEKVLTTDATVTCLHDGDVSLSSSQSVLTVAGNPVLVNQLTGSITNCTQQPPPATNKPCTLASPQTTGISSVLTVNGLPVLLESAAGLTDGSPTNSWSVQDAKQNVLQSD